MKRKITFATLFVLTILTGPAFAQWTTSGTNIYNTNTGNVGIGITSPTSKLDVLGPGTISEVIKASNNFTNSLRLLAASNTDFHHAAFTAYRSRGTVTAPSNVLAGDRIGGLYGASYVNGSFRGNASIEFYAGNTVGATSFPTYTIFMTTPNNGTTRLERMRISESGNIGIGTSSPSYLLDVNGTVRAISVIQTSDENFKENIKPFEGALNKVSKIKGYTYTINKEKLHAADVLPGQRIGFLAQEIKKVIPEAVSSDENGTLGVDYLAVIPVMLEAIKELKNQIDEVRDNRIEDIVLKKDELAISQYPGAMLDQNHPNPFKGKTAISYSVPDNAATAAIVIHTLNGAEVSRLNLTSKGKGIVDLQDEKLTSGLYLYTLVLDDKPIITKKLFVSQ